jgi:hypothetical protein
MSGAALLNDMRPKLKRNLDETERELAQQRKQQRVRDVHPRSHTLFDYIQRLAMRERSWSTDDTEGEFAQFVQ